ncbi:hypothetical protein [Desulfofalx alkaliphila]|uniref:hypothetical protein n=1 Tax=Desulfofalx alkaliphila TaxID=105483 RepID=UPI00068C3A73|nr:hypothetical protein [Desulfofalx alkaliphila]
MHKPITVFFNLRLLAKILLFVIPLVFLARIYLPAQPAQITFTALRWPGEIEVVNQQDADDIMEALRYVHKVREPGPPEKMALYLMTIQQGKKKQQYLITEKNEYFCLDGTAVLPSYRLREIVNHYTARLERLSPYGRLIPWSEARHIFGRFVKGTVEDIDTGLRFDVQRREGRYHADVQPLTARDTAIMKEIYEGEWSWRRKAVVVEVDNMRIAASMSGMPHGAGAIKHNEFDGHFCLHFLDSTTHNNPESTNLAHQIMVWKAAGRLPEMLANASPEKVVEIFLTSLGQQAPDISLLTLAGEPALDAKDFMLRSTQVESINYEIVEYNKDTDTVTAKVQIDYLDGPRGIQKELEFRMVHSMGYWWKIDPRNIELIFEPKATAGFKDLGPVQEKCF